MVSIIGLEFLLGWGRLQLFGLFGYVEMARFLIIKIHPLCRSSTGSQLCSVHGCVYNMWRITTYGDVFTVGGHGEGYFF
jgi:hypothetical protein